MIKPANKTAIKPPYPHNNQYLARLVERIHSYLMANQHYKLDRLEDQWSKGGWKEELWDRIMWHVGQYSMTVTEMERNE